MLEFFLYNFKSAVTVKYLILFIFFHLEPIFNAVYHSNMPHTIAMRQQWLPPDVPKCMVFTFNLIIQICYYVNSSIHVTVNT